MNSNISDMEQALTTKTYIKASGKMKTLYKVLNLLALPLILLMVWEYCSRMKIFPPVLIPSLETIGSTVVDGFRSGEIPQDLLVSILRVLKGYSIGIVLGIIFGIGMGISTRTNRFFSLLFDGIRQIPPLAWIPLIILWFGIGETSKIILIAKSSFFPILLNTINGIHNVPKGYLEVAKLYDVRKKDLLLKVYFPSTLPSVFVGLRLGAGAAWMSVVAAEMIASTSGIGYRINDARNLMESNVVIVDMIIIGIIGCAMDYGLKWIVKRVSKWEKV